MNHTIFIRITAKKTFVCSTRSNSENQTKRKKETYYSQKTLCVFLHDQTPKNKSKNNQKHGTANHINHQDARYDIVYPGVHNPYDTAVEYYQTCQPLENKTPGMHYTKHKKMKKIPQKPLNNHTRTKKSSHNLWYQDQRNQLRYI